MNTTDSNPSKPQTTTTAHPEQDPAPDKTRSEENHWTPPTAPNRFSYRVGEDRIWACEYPGDKDDYTAINKVGKALEFGITHFIDLTEEGELRPYAHFLPSTVSHLRFPIQDVSIPASIPDTYRLMQQIQDILRDTRNRIYLHCWGGVGRTGTIVACWIAFTRHTDFNTTMSELQRFWKQCPKSSYRNAPETAEQVRFIQDFITYIDQNI